MAGYFCAYKKKTELITRYSVSILFEMIFKGINLQVSMYIPYCKVCLEIPYENEADTNGA